MKKEQFLGIILLLLGGFSIFIVSYYLFGDSFLTAFAWGIKSIVFFFLILLGKKIYTKR